MPTYDYACTACGNTWELEQRITESAIDTCPKCGDKTAKRQISGGGAFILKGGGWYADLYSSSGGNKGGSGSAGATGAAPAASTESKPASTAPAAAASTTPSSGSSSGSGGTST